MATWKIAYPAGEAAETALDGAAEVVVDSDGWKMRIVVVGDGVEIRTSAGSAVGLSVLPVAPGVVRVEPRHLP